ncbi:hypothetical protein MtrunA17_Chr3g0080621 [Medicago truncatula]|uniref:Uncharacterized protein n=1 Tax=Medicago truncatula TaxID=3880 RepID=A0A396IIM3_MEDTR|nr:hypothetical protein MtrunA17_Chr3g0080621 [Medicago truncatula]
MKHYRTKYIIFELHHREPKFLSTIVNLKRHMKLLIKLTSFVKHQV